MRQAKAVRGRGQTGPRGLESDPAFERGFLGNDRPLGSVKDRLGVNLAGGINKKLLGPRKNAPAVLGGDLRGQLNRKANKAAQVGDLRDLIGQEPSKRLVKVGQVSSGLAMGRRRRQNLISPVLAAAVLEMGKQALSSSSVQQRIGGQFNGLWPKAQLKTIRRTVDNPIALQDVKFVVRNTSAEDRFLDLTINRSFPAVKTRPAAKVGKKQTRMEIDEEEEEGSDTYSEDEESRHTPSPPPPPPPPPRARPVVKKVPKKSTSTAAAPTKAKKSAMAMNRVRLASLPDNVSTKEVTELCEDFGEIFRVNRIGKGVFEIDFEREEDARKAVLQCSQATLDGEPLQVSLLPSTAPASSPSISSKSTGLQSRLKPKSSIVAAGNKGSQVVRKKAT